MFCIKCGKQIPDDAQFCNYCGNRVVTMQSQPAPQPQPQPRPAPQPQVQNQTVSNTQAYTSSAPKQNAAANQPKKKGCFGRILVLIIAAVVYLVVRYGAENIPSLFGGVSKSEFGAAANNGALYQNGYLTYGLTRLSLPGYELVDGDSGDYMLSSDRMTSISVNKHSEDKVSYSASDKQGIIDSYKYKFSYQQVEVLEFSKYKVDGYPVIEYIISCNYNGEKQYIGELIIFPSNTTNYTLRYNMNTAQANGNNVISRAFDTLSISKDYKYDINPTGIVLYPEKQITVR